MEDSECSSESAEDRLVLSEVHLGKGTSGTRCNGDLEDEVVVSRYQYLVPSVDGDKRRSNKPRSNSGESDSEGSDSSNGGSDIVIRRRRKRPRVALSHQSLQSSWKPAHEVLTIVHQMATPVSLVGQQVWSAAFLLGDFILTHEELFAGAKVLELGAGPGVAGIIAARVARQTFVTDYHDEVLALLARNTEANMHLASYNNAATAATHSEGVFCGGTSSPGRSVEVRRLDWSTFWMDKTQAHENNHRQNVAAESQERGMTKSGATHDGDPFAWKSGELEQLLSMRAAGDRLIFLASDVIYDEDLTEALFRALKTLMPPYCCVMATGSENGTSNQSSPTQSPASESHQEHGSSAGTLAVKHCSFVSNGGKSTSPKQKNDATAIFSCSCCSLRDCRKDGAVLYLALEKRFNFTLAELPIAATGYRALRRHVWNASDGAREGSSAQDHHMEFEGIRLPLTFVQCFRYTRSHAMEIWEIRRRALVPSLAENVLSKK